MKHLIKASGSVQVFSANKLQNSIIASLHAVHKNAADTQEISVKVTQEVVNWLHNKQEVSSVDVRTAAAASLAKYDKDAAVVYKKHKDMW